MVPEFQQNLTTKKVVSLQLLHMGTGNEATQQRHVIQGSKKYHAQFQNDRLNVKSTNQTNLQKKKQKNKDKLPFFFLSAMDVDTSNNMTDPSTSTTKRLVHMPKTKLPPRPKSMSTSHSLKNSDQKY